MALAAHLGQVFVNLYDAFKQAIGNTTKLESLLLENFKSTEMALAARLGHVFVILYDAVEQAIDNTTKFKSLLLENFKCTLDFLEPRIKRIGECKLLQNPQLMEKLIVQMNKGVELVGKFSKSSKFINVWKYCFWSNDDDYANQLVELDRYLRRLLEFLWRHEEGVVIQNQFRELRYMAGEVKSLARNLVETLEKPLLASNVERPLKQSEVWLITWFPVLLDFVTKAEEKSTTKMFKPLFGDLNSTLASLKPFVEKRMVLDLAKEEVENFKALMEKGFELVNNELLLGRVDRSYNKKYVKMNQLLELNHSLQRQLSILRKKTAGDLSKELESSRNIVALVSELEKSTTVVVPKEQARDAINAISVLTQNLA